MKYVLVIAGLFVMTGLAQSSMVTNVTILAVSTDDIVYDPVTKLIYGSQTANNSIISIDPYAKKVGSSYLIGTNPTSLAIGQQGGIIYATTISGTALRPFDTFTKTTDDYIRFPTPYTGQSVTVSPTDSHVVAVSITGTGSPGFQGVMLYNDGSLVSSTKSGYATTIRFGDTGSRIYGYNGDLSSFEYSRFAVTPTSISLVDHPTSSLSKFNQKIRYDKGRVYTTQGVVINAEEGYLVGNIATSNLLLDAAHGRGFGIDGGNLSLYSINDDPKELLYFKEEVINLGSATYSSMTLFGENGLAIRSSDGKVILLEFGVTSVPEPSSWMLVGGLAVSWVLRRRTLRAARRHPAVIDISSPGPKGPGILNLP